MLTEFRRKLGKLKEQLEQRVVTLGSGGKPRGEQAPLSDTDRQFMLDWLTGKVDDGAMIAHARTGGGGRSLIERACAARPSNPHLWAARAQWCLDEGANEEALEHAERAQAIGWRQPGVGLVLARALVAAGRREEALRNVAAGLGNARRMSTHAQLGDITIAVGSYASGDILTRMRFSENRRIGSEVKLRSAACAWMVMLVDPSNR